MKRDFNTTIQNINGEDMLELVQADSQETKPVNFRTICINALQTLQENDDKIDGTKRLELIELAMKINTEGEVDITPAERDIIKARVSKVRYNSHIIEYRVHKFLEGE